MKATGKDHARINLAIWGDDDFRDLTPAEQHLYFVLWTSPGLSYCGSGDWHPGRLASSSAGWTKHDVKVAAAGLSRKLFVLVDGDTDEFLIRSWIKHDGLWRTPNMAVSVANARADLASRALRGVIVHELVKVRETHPDSSSWKRDAVVSMLEQTAVDPVDVEPYNPTSNPGSKGGSNPDANPGSNPWPQNRPNPGPTPTPAPTPISYSPTPRVSTLPERHQGADVPATRTEIRLRQLNSTARSAAADQVARKFNEWAGGGIPSQTLIEVAVEVDGLLRDELDPRQIANGIIAWHSSDRLYASQIPHFVAKAARGEPGAGKPTRKAETQLSAAEAVIAEMEAAS